jgi:hypothetical protein
MKEKKRRRDMKNPNQLERLTVLVGRDDIARVKHIAVDRKISTSEIVRSVVSDFLKGAETQDRISSSPPAQEGAVRRG